MELINIKQANIDGTPTNAVDARELHDTLGVKKAFTTWIKTNLDSIGAEEHKDYMYFKNSLEGSGYKKVYIITADIAKHIAMMSKLPKGKEVRDYFIEVEKKSNTALMSPTQITEALALTARSLQLQDERLDSQHERIQDVEVNMEEVKQYIQKDIQNRPIGHTQQTALLNARHKKVFQILESYGDDKDDKELKRRTYAKVGSLFKKEFDLPRYDSLPNVKFNYGLAFINNLSLKDMT